MKLQQFLLKFKNIAAVILIAVFSIFGIISCSGDAITGSGGSDGYTYTGGITVQPGVDNTGEYITPDTTPEPEPAPEPETTPTTKPTVDSKPEQTPTSTTPTRPTPGSPDPIDLPANNPYDLPPQATPPANNYYPARTYMEVYTPFSGKDKQIVSWQDTNVLAQIWKDMINRKGPNDGTRWFIRDGDNRYHGGNQAMQNGNYYFFDKNFDIIYVHQTHDNIYNVKVKKFLGGLIVKYRRGDHDGTWTIGGLYETMLNKTKDSQNGGKGYTDYNNDCLNEFMRGIHAWQRGDLEVIVLNAGFKFGSEYGIDSYYCTMFSGGRNSKEYYLAPWTARRYGPHYYDDRLNCGVNHSWNLDRFNFKFAYGTPLNWHLTKDFK